MIGTTLNPKRKGDPTYRVTGSAGGGGWIVARTDAHESPRVLAAGELENFKVGDGELVAAPDNTPASVADLEARGWQALAGQQNPTIANFPTTEEGRALIRVIGPAGGYSDLDIVRREFGKPTGVLPEDVFAVEAPGDDNEAARESAATNVARAILADPVKREEAQRGSLSMHPAVFRRVRELLGKEDPR